MRSWAPSRTARSPGAGAPTRSRSSTAPGPASRTWLRPRARMNSHNIGALASHAPYRSRRLHGSGFLTLFQTWRQRSWRLSFRGLLGVAAGLALEIRCAGRPDRGDAPDHRRREEVGLGRTFPARAQLLHAPAPSGGAAAVSALAFALPNVQQWTGEMAPREHSRRVVLLQVLFRNRRQLSSTA